METFAALPAISGPQLSPDGTKVAAKIAGGGRQLLIVQPLLGEGKAAALGESGAEINWWRWVNDQWLVVGVGDQQTLYGEEVYVTRIIGVSADMKKIVRIDWDRSGIDADDVIWIAQDGSTRLLLAKQTGIEEASEWYPSVHEVDVSTGRTKRVVPSAPEVWEWDADATGTVRHGVIYKDGKRRGMLYRGTAGERFSKIRFSSADEDSVPLPLVYRPDGSAVAVSDKNGRDELYELALPSFTLGKKLFGDPRYDVDGLYPSRTGDAVDGVSIIDRRERVEWFDPSLREVQQALDQTLGAGNALIVSRSRDGSTLLVEVGGPSQAGALYYWNTAGAAMHRIGWNNANLKGRKLSAVSTVEYKARDGTPIEAVLTLPRGRDPKSLPLIVMPHGGPHARDSESFDWWTQFLAEQGYAVIQPNYRGSTGYGKSFFELGRGQWGLKMQDDLIDAIDWAATQGIADPKRVCIIGASYGGYAAMRGAQRDTGRYRCAVSYAGVSDLNSMLKYDRQYLGKWMVDYWKKQASDLTSVSPRFYAGTFQTPILIAHGAKDKRVPVKQSRMLADELRKAGKPFDYLEQKEGDHHFSRAEDRLEFLKAMKAFLDRHNPA